MQHQMMRGAERDALENRIVDVLDATLEDDDEGNKEERGGGQEGVPVSVDEGSSASWWDLDEIVQVVRVAPRRLHLRASLPSCSSN